MRVELTRYRVKPGKSARVDEWLQTLNDRADECLESMVREKMNVEIVFREQIGDEEFLYWFTIQHETGEELNTSPHEISHIHLTFWEECLDRDYGGKDAYPQLVLVPPHIAQVIEWPDPARDGRIGYPQHEDL